MQDDGSTWKLFRSCMPVGHLAKRVDGMAHPDRLNEGPSERTANGQEPKDGERERGGGRRAEHRRTAEREREGERPRCGARPPSASVHPSIGSARASTRGREGEGVRAAGRAPAPMQLVVEIAQKSVSENAALNVKMLGMSRSQWELQRAHASILNRSFRRLIANRPVPT